MSEISRFFPGRISLEKIKALQLPRLWPGRGHFKLKGNRMGRGGQKMRAAQNRTVKIGLALTATMSVFLAVVFSFYRSMFRE
jgi:hypothetical protein